jgi:ABC-2 type transport system ATP-binding protein
MDAVVSARHLGKSIGSKTILRDITVDVAAGNVVGVVGKNGAGKTTLLRVLLGFSSATGTATLFGADSFHLPATAKRRIGFVPQQDDLIATLTGAQHLSLNASLHKTWDPNFIDRLIEEWEVPTQRLVGDLSAGERQKLSTLLALGHRPDLMIFDEPASNLDPVARRRFLTTILEMAQSPQRTILFSSHIVSDLERVANQIWILREGSIIWQGDLDTLKETVVRLTILSRAPLPPSLGIADTLSEIVDGRSATVIVGRWEEACREDLMRRLDARVDVDSMSLDDIFLVLHS